MSNRLLRHSNYLCITNKCSNSICDLYETIPNFLINCNLTFYWKLQSSSVISDKPLQKHNRLTWELSFQFAPNNLGRGAESLTGMHGAQGKPAQEPSLGVPRSPGSSHIPGNCSQQLLGKSQARLAQTPSTLACSELWVYPPIPKLLEHTTTKFHIYTIPQTPKKKVQKWEYLAYIQTRLCLEILEFCQVPFSPGKSNPHSYTLWRICCTKE